MSQTGASGSGSDEQQGTFPVGGGVLGDLIRRFDWSRTSLGPLSAWPQSLKTTTSLLLLSPVPIVLLWGEDGVMIYNDAYSVFAGGRHPRLLGSKVREGWAEIADFNDNVMRVVLAGRTLAYRDQELTLVRHGRPEPVWMNLDYSPVLDEIGRPAGVIAIVVETTQRVLADRLLRDSEARFRALTDATSDVVYRMSADWREMQPLDGRGFLSDFDTPTIRWMEANLFPEDHAAIRVTIEEAIRTKTTFRLEHRVRRADGSAGWTFSRAIPTLDEHGAIKEWFGAASDVTERRRAEAYRDALIRLTAEIQTQDDPDETAFLAATILGETLGVSRAGYSAVDPTDDSLTWIGHWAASGDSTPAPTQHLRDYGALSDDLKRGTVVVVADAGHDLRTSDAAPALAARSARAFINVPLTEKDRIVALCYASQAEPRAWTAEDIGLIREVAARTRTAIERRRAERNVRRLNETLEAQVEERTQERDRLWRISRDPFLITDAEGRWLRVSPAWTDILGWTEEELVGRTSEWMEHPDDRGHTRARTSSLAGGARTLRFENRFRGLDGDYRWFSWTAVPEGGLIYGVARDITTERERETALRDSQDFTRLAFAAVGGVGVWRYEVEGDRFFCDATISDLYGLDPDEARDGIRRERFMAHVHPDDLSKLRAVMTEGLQRSGDLELEFRVLHPTGRTRWVLSRGHTHHDEAGRPLRRTGVGIETTRQRQLEEQLRQSQKMEAVGQLTGGIAHDFNNLLTGVLGSLELVSARIAQGRLDDVARYSAAAQGAAKRAAALTHRLLAFSRRQTLDPKPTDANRLVAGMTDLVRRTVGPSIVIETVAAVGLWPTPVDAGQLENSLLNLCINARDAMPAGGRITIETANRWVDRSTAASHDLPPGQYISMCVSDTGTGMTPDVIARAFDPFFTTKPIGLGTGLGLSMIYGFVRQSGGQVRIYSEVGHGTTVCIYLPRFHGEVEEAPEVPSLADAPRAGAGETVLVVDDEPSVRMLVTETLEDLGYHSIEAADGPAGLKVLQSDARIDLLVSDVGLPGTMNGRQMADAARVKRPDLKVLFITGFAENAVIGDGHLEPGMHVMTKPFAMEVLATRIKELIVGGEAERRPPGRPGGR